MNSVLTFIQSILYPKTVLQDTLMGVEISWGEQKQWSLKWTSETDDDDDCAGKCDSSPITCNLVIIKKNNHHIQYTVQ
jgi:hypothetical protein